MNANSELALGELKFRSINLDRLKELPAQLDTSRFRAWLRRADATLLRALEHAVAGGRAAPVRLGTQPALKL